MPGGSWSGYGGLRTPNFGWLGVVLTVFQPRLAIHATYAQLLRETYGELVLNAPVPYNVAFKECVVVRKPLALWKPKTAAAKAIDSVAGDVLDRVAWLRGQKQENAA